MIIYNTIIIGLIIIQVIFKTFNIKNKKIICIISFLFLLFVSAFRDINVGTDLIVYCNRYEIIANSSWDYLPYFHERWGFEYGFLIFIKLLTYISTSPYFFIFISSTIILLSFTIFIYKYSEIPFYSFFIFVGLNMFGTSMNIIRLYLACAILLFSIKYILSKNLYIFCLIVIIASLFHSSAMVFIIFYPLCKLKETNIFYLLSFMISLIVFVFGKKIIEILLRLGSDYYFDRYAEGIGTGDGEIILLFFIGILIIYIFFKKNNIIKKNFTNTIWIKFLILSIILGFLSLHLNIAARLLWYTKAGLIITIPNIISNIKRLDFRILLTLMITGFIFVIYFTLIKSPYVGVVPYSSWLF